MVYLILKDKHDCDPVDVPTEDIVGVARNEGEKEEMLNENRYSVEVDLNG